MTNEQEEKEIQEGMMKSLPQEATPAEIDASITDCIGQEATGEEWETECLAGAPWTQDGKALLNKIHSLLSRTQVAQREGVAKLKKYSGKHNAAHTWITEGYCHACKEHLSKQQLVEEFGWNAAIDEVLSLPTSNKEKI